MTDSHLPHPRGAATVAVRSAGGSDLPNTSASVGQVGASEPGTEEHRTTIADIAELADVSVPTVSKVLNGRAGVAASTRRRVLELLDEHGYRRRGTATRKPVGLIDFVIRHLDTVWAIPLVQGAESEAAKAGVSLVVTSMHGRRVGNRHWIQHLTSRRTDAIVLVVSELQPGAEDELAKLNMPVVLVDPVGGANPELPAISATNWAGGLTATQHLASLGHTRIGLITGPEDVTCARERMYGYREGLSRAGLEYDPNLERFGDFMPHGGETMAAELLSLDNPPTAIFAGTDQTAAGVYLEAQRRKLRIPQDLSVIGFDDVIVGEWLNPKLTTIRQPLEDMAREAIRTALALVHEGSIPHSRIELPTSLVLRESTARVKPRGY